MTSTTLPMSQTAMFDKALLAFTKHSVMFSKTTSAKLVGGRARLGKLIVNGKVRMQKKSEGKANGKWYCNASDVLRNIKI